MLELVVYGTPVPAGSKRAFTRKGGGVGVEDTAENRMKPWRAALQAAAGDAMSGHELLQGPLSLHVEFHLARPKGHYGARGLRPSAPTHPTVKPDTTKLLRGLEDALTGIVWRDDAQIVTQHAEKRYATGPEHVRIKVAQLVP